MIFLPVRNFISASGYVYCSGYNFLFTCTTMIELSDRLLSSLSMYCCDLYILYTQILFIYDSYSSTDLQILELRQEERNDVYDMINIHISRRRAFRSSQTITKLGVQWYCPCQHAFDSSQTNTKLDVWQCRPYRCSGTVQSRGSERKATRSQDQIMQICDAPSILFQRNTTAMWREERRWRSMWCEVR